MGSVGAADRLISFGVGLPEIPERLLLAHASGKVLFIAGAGISQPAQPNFRELVIAVYKEIDPYVYPILISIPKDACNKYHIDLRTLNPRQAAEVRRFIIRDYDVVLGMLERRIDGVSSPISRVREAVGNILRNPKVKPQQMHSVLMRLADRGSGISIATTNFELLLEESAKKIKPKIQTYALGGIPRPGHSKEFSGVFHIHGVLERNPNRVSDLILSDHDFGEFYLRRRSIPDFIYDAARLFNIVLVGYSANDPPMRYLLNAVAADGNRFEDLKERFTFIGSESFDNIDLEDWKARGITPIPYLTKSGDHGALLEALTKWSKIFSINGSEKLIDKELKRIVKNKLINSSDSDRDLFEHIIRRSNPKERLRISDFISKLGADFSWLDSIITIGSEKSREL